MNMQKYQAHYITMTEAGFIAVNQSDEDSAVKLFKAASLLAPEQMLPKIGFGYIHLCKLELKQAAKVFSEVLEVEPDNDMAKTFLGLSLSLNPTELSKGEEILTETGKTAKDPMIKDLAANALKFVMRFVKKAPSPVEVSSPQK
ncbi:MAG: SctF chaperone SctG [Chlamydiae bacterium]|nr:SctF chaperone SctG [Chlamydiota bacterium]